MPETTRYSDTQNTGTPGDYDWTNIVNVEADDNVYASVILPSDGGTFTSYRLKLTNFGFSVGGSILGIKISLERYSNGNFRIKDHEIYLTKDGSTPVGDNKAGSSYWTTGLVVVNYGGSADLWGTTWSASEVNNSNFGCIVRVRQDSPLESIAYVDYVTVTIYYGDITISAETQNISTITFAVVLPLVMLNQDILSNMQNVDLFTNNFIDMNSKLLNSIFPSPLQFISYGIEGYRQSLPVVILRHGRRICPVIKRQWRVR